MSSQPSRKRLPFRLVAHTVAFSTAFVSLWPVAASEARPAMASPAGRVNCALIDAHEVSRLVLQRRHVRDLAAVPVPDAVRERDANPRAYEAFLRRTKPAVVPIVTARLMTDADRMNLRAAAMMDERGASFRDVLAACANVTRISDANVCPNPNVSFGASGMRSRRFCGNPPECPPMRVSNVSTTVNADYSRLNGNNWCDSSIYQSSFDNSNGSSFGNYNTNQVMLSGMMGTSGSIPGFSGNTVYNNQSVPTYVASPKYAPHNGWVSVGNSNTYNGQAVTGYETSGDGTFGQEELYAGNVDMGGVATAQSGSNESITVTGKLNSPHAEATALEVVGGALGLIGAGAAIVGAFAGVTLSAAVILPIIIAGLIVAFVGAALAWIGSLLDAEEV